MLRIGQLVADESTRVVGIIIGIDVIKGQGAFAGDQVLQVLTTPVWAYRPVIITMYESDVLGL